MLTNNRSMKRAIAALCVATLACSAVGCGEEKKEAIPTFSNATYIAQMATLKCYYHNTAKLSHEGSWGSSIMATNVCGWNTVAS